MKGVISAHPKLESAFQVQDTKNRITHRKSAAFYRAMSADAATAHGRTPVFALVDELHAWKKRELWDAIKTGLVKTPGSLLVVTTTAGIGRENVAHDVYQYARQVATGVIEDEAFLPILFEADPEEDWRDEAVWLRVNPGLSANPPYPDIDGMRQMVREAEHRPADREMFRQLHLNIWLDGAANPEWDLTIWDEGHGEIDLEALRGRKAWIGVVAGFAAATKAVAELGDAAKMAGVSAKSFQEWRYVAEQARIPIDAMTDGLKEMSLRADEFAQTGKGSAAEAFQRLGLSPQEVKERLKDPSEFLLLLINRTKQLNDTAAGVRIFDELFGGTGGERMVSLLAQGEKGIRAQIKAANDLGIVINDDLINRAAELDAKFNTIVHTVGQNLKAAIVSASDSLVDFIDRWRATESQMAGTLTARQAEVDSKRLDLENKILETTNNQLLTQQQRNKAVGQYRIELQKLTEESGAIAGALGTKLPEVSKTTDRTFTPITPPDPKAESARAKATREAERERQAVTDLIAQLDFEYSLIGKSAAQQDKMNALRQAGAAATAEEQLAIANKIDAINRESEAYEKTKAAAEEARDAARDFAGTLVDGFIEGASAAEVLGNALKNLGSRLINSGLDSLFNMGGGLFNVFGGGGGKSSFPSAPGSSLFSEGGYTGDGGKYQPAGVVHKGEYVMDADTVRKAGGPAAMEAMRRGLKGYADGGYVGAMPALSPPSIPDMKSVTGGTGGSAVTLAPVYHIDARGADAAAVARLEKGLAKTNAEMQSRIEAGVRSAQKRNVKFN